MLRRYEPAVSLHAVERWQERIDPDMSSDLIRKLILETPEIANALAAGAQRITHGIVTLMARHGNVVSVYPAEWGTTPDERARAQGRRGLRKVDRKRGVGMRRIQASWKARILRVRMGKDSSDGRAETKKR